MQCRIHSSYPFGPLYVWTCISPVQYIATRNCCTISFPAKSSFYICWYIRIQIRSVGEMILNVVYKLAALVNVCKRDSLKSEASIGRGVPGVSRNPNSDEAHTNFTAKSTAVCKSRLLVWPYCCWVTYMHADD